MARFYRHRGGRKARAQVQGGGRKCSGSREGAEKARRQKPGERDRAGEARIPLTVPPLAAEVTSYRRGGGER